MDIGAGEILSTDIRAHGCGLFVNSPKVQVRILIPAAAADWAVGIHPARKTSCNEFYILPPLGSCKIPQRFSMCNQV